MNTDPMIVSLRGPNARPPEEESQKQKTKVKTKYIGIALFTAGVLLLLSAVLFLYVNRSVVARFIELSQAPTTTDRKDTSMSDDDGTHTPITELQAKATAEAEANTEIEDIVSKVGKLIRLPNDEVPTVATVTKPNELKDQLFFADAKVGDKVLIYTKAQQAFLYDPTANILVKVAPITTEAVQ